MTAKQHWLQRHADRLRAAVFREPRGHRDLCGAVLTEPVSTGAHTGVVFMDGERYRSMSGHGIIAATTIALERGIVVPGGDGRAIVFDTAAGTVRARPRPAPEPSGSDPNGSVRVASVSFTNVPSFVLLPGVEVKAGARLVRVDVAYGGEYLAIVDSESAGLSIDAAHLPELRRVGEAIRHAVAPMMPLPGRTGDGELAGTVFIGPARSSGADLRSVRIFEGGGVDRSPSGSGTSAIMAVIDAMGMLTEERPFVCESLIGTRFEGRVAARRAIGEREAIVPEIEGSAWITGEHLFVFDADDPLAEGYML
jgi:proline racemase